MIERLVTFFATGDSIVANNLVVSLYKHINVPEARMYLSRQLYEEALHVQFYLTLLDNYVPDQEQRARAFAAIDNVPSIWRKAILPALDRLCARFACVHGGLLPGLASGTNWVFRDESAHMAFAYEVLRTVRHEEPELFDSHWAAQVRTMIEEASRCASTCNSWPTNGWRC